MTDPTAAVDDYPMATRTAIRAPTVNADADRMRPLPDGWRWVRLGDICELNPRRPALLRADDTPTTFIPMSAVGEGGSGIVAAEERSYQGIKSGYTYFGEGDVLFAKITPCMQNGKHAIAENLIDGLGFGSTEFHVIHPKGSVIPEWIHSFIMQPDVLEAAKAYFTGAVGQQRVPKSYLEELQVPLPPIPEQQRIAAILREQMAAVEQARAAAEAQLEAARALPAAYLRAVFESDEARQWPSVALGKVLRLRKEVVHPHDKPVGPATFVGLEHVESHTGKRIGSAQVEMSELTGRKPRFYRDDLVYGYLRPYLNKVWVADFDGLCSVDQYVYSVDPKLADTRYILWFMLSPTYLERAPIDKTPGQLPRIRTEEVAEVEVPLPPKEEQQRIAATLDEHMAGAQQLRRMLQDQLDAIETLPAALLRQAFNGEL